MRKHLNFISALMVYITVLLLPINMIFAESGINSIGYKAPQKELDIEILNLRVVQINSNQVKITWDKSGTSKVEMYFVDKFIENEPYSSYQTLPFGISGLYFYDVALTPGMTYTYRVWATSYESGSGQQSDYSEEISIKIEPLPKKPDLLISKIYTDPLIPQENEFFDVYFIIENKGNAAVVPRFKFLVKKDATDEGYEHGNSGWTRYCSVIEPAGSCLAELAPQALWNYDHQGEYKISIDLDTENEVDEVDEANNLMLYLVNVKSKDENTPPGKISNIQVSDFGKSDIDIITYKNPTDVDLHYVKVYLSDAIGKIGKFVEPTLPYPPIAKPGADDEYRVTCSSKNCYYVFRAVDQLGNENQNLDQYDKNGLIAPDLDGDGVSSFEEVRNGSDPNNPNSHIGDRVQKKEKNSTNLISKASLVDKYLVNRLKGKILLQVEEHGEAWYINPENGYRYYLKDGPTAFKLMRNFGLGISNKDLSKIPESDSNQIGNEDLIKRVMGKILLQVENRGEAWYVNPGNGKRYYMENGDAAYRIMRELGLGITNKDIAKIPIDIIEE